MQRRLTTQDVTWFLDANGLGRLDLEPSYQRKSVWTRADRQYFLDTIFNNYPSPAIFLHKEMDDSGNATYHVVDGKQRLETILMFVDNKLSIRDNIGDTRLANKKWRDLSSEPELKHRLWDYQFTVEMLDSIEPAVVNDVFGRLNQNSRKLMAQEIRHSRYNGWFITFAESESDRPIWRELRVSTPARARRMADVQFISELMAVSILKQVSGFDQDWIDELYARYEDPELIEPNFDRDLFAESFSIIASFLIQAEEHDEVVSRFASNSAHLYSLWAWLTLTETIPPVGRFSEVYSDFMRAVAEVVSGGVESGTREEVRSYAENSRGASTDLKQRTERHKALATFLDAALGL